MKTRFLIITVGIIIAISIIFTIFFEYPSKKQHYEIKVTGMKDVYLVGEKYDFSYILSGYGNPCGYSKITFPDQNGDTVQIVSSSSCFANTPMKEFVLDFQKNDTTYGHVGIKNPGTYAIGVEFERSATFEPTQGGKSFHVVEKICDDSDSKAEAQCFAESFELCKSSYMSQQFFAENGGLVSLKAIIESWNDCQLRVYSENSLGEHTPFNGIRSVCENMTVNENSLNFENCNNADYPPIMFPIQNSES